MGRGGRLRDWKFGGRIRRYSSEVSVDGERWGEGVGGRGYLGERGKRGWSWESRKEGW